MGNSILVLIAAVVLLWLAVTGRLPRLIDALDVVKGTETASAAGQGQQGVAVAPSLLGLPAVPQIVSFPSLPDNAAVNSVGI